MERGLADPKRVLNRWVNGVLGVVHVIVTALTFRGSPLFYQMVVVLEIELASLMVWHAFRWPRHDASVRWQAIASSGPAPDILDASELRRGTRTLSPRLRAST
ncbi:MAG TPA: hypothetical protein VF584_26115 [Longimicrobium sp.]